MTPADLVKEFEGLRLEAYQDQAGVWTIGYGHTGPDARPGVRITEAEALELLADDLAWAEAAVDRTVKVPLSAEQYAALVSLVFNIGSGAWEQSTALRRLNAGDFAGAAEAMTWWNKITVDGQKVVSKGLVNRRERERALFMSNVSVAGTVSEGGSVTGGEQKPMHKSVTMNTSFIGALMTGFAGAAQAFVGMDWRVAVPLILVGCAFGYLAFNRWLEARRGEH